MPPIIELLSTSMSLLSAVHSYPGSAVTTPSSETCRPGGSACAGGWTGPRCDIACLSDRPCASAVYCHGWGDTYGLSTFGTFLFPTTPADSTETLWTKLYRFILEHPESLGLDAGLAPWDLDLSPARDLRSDAGGLQIFRFTQSYRKLPIFGPDATVRLIVAPGGALGLRGAIVDGRQEYIHVADHSSASAAEASIRYHVMNRLDLAADTFDVRDLRLVAVPRTSSLGWAASVDDGLTHLATVVVDADPKPLSSGHPELLYFDRDLAEGLDDPVDITALVEDPASDILQPPITSISRDSLLDATPLQGSTAGADVALADERVVAYNAAGAPDQMALTKATLPYSSVDASFQEPVGTDGFDVQSTYFAARSMYAWTDRLMAGRWQSLLGADSAYPPGEFSPRLMIFENVEYNACPNQAFCVNRGVILGPLELTPTAYQQPLEGPTFETLAYMSLEQAAHGPDLIGHEFGHVVDLFASPGYIESGLTCTNCGQQCEPDTTDEASPLTESFANFASLWYLRDLYAVGQSPTSCSVLQSVSLGMNDTPHVEGCIDEGNRVALFRPANDCPAGFACDALAMDDASPETGICRPSAGYRIDSFHQALWESMHAQSCALDPPHGCEARPALTAQPAGDLVGGALLYALRVDTATYRGFADDMATHVACNHGASAYEAFNEILCHHAIRDCDAPTPVVCKMCGNGVAEPDEACDGTDLSGQTCVKLGYSGGALMCDADCALDDSQCVSDIPTTGVDSDVPTSAPPELDPVGASDESGPGEESAEHGCSCANGRAPTPWAFLLLGAASLRVGRRRGPAMVALGALLLTVTGCLADRTQSETDSDTADTTATTDTMPDVDIRMFGKFHTPDIEVGYINPGADTFYFWSTMEIRADGTLVMLWYLCEGAPEVQEFTWTQLADNQLQVVPQQLNPDGTFQFLAHDVTSVTLTPGAGCDNIVTRAEFAPDSDLSTSELQWLPGEVCAKSLGATCKFEFVWCDGEAPPICTQSNSPQ